MREGLIATPRLEERELGIAKTAAWLCIQLKQIQEQGIRKLQRRKICAGKCQFGPIMLWIQAQDWNWNLPVAPCTSFRMWVAHVAIIKNPRANVTWQQLKNRGATKKRNRRLEKCSWCMGRIVLMFGLRSLDGWTSITGIQDTANSTDLFLLKMKPNRWHVNVFRSWW